MPPLVFCHPKRLNRFVKGGSRQVLSTVSLALVSRFFHVPKRFLSIVGFFSDSQTQEETSPVAPVPRRGKTFLREDPLFLHFCCLAPSEYHTATQLPDPFSYALFPFLTISPSSTTSSYRWVPPLPFKVIPRHPRSTLAPTMFILPAELPSRQPPSGFFYNWCPRPVVFKRAFVFSSFRKLGGPLLVLLRLSNSSLPRFLIPANPGPVAFLEKTRTSLTFSVHFSGQLCGSKQVPKIQHLAHFPSL